MLERRLIWQALLAFLFAASAIAILAFEEFQRERSRLEENLLQTVSALGQVVDREIEGVLRFTIARTASSPALQTDDFAAFRQESLRALEATKIADHMAVIDQSGQQLVNTLVAPGAALPVTKNIKHIETVFTTGRPLISDLSVGTISGNYEIFVDVPFIRDGRVVYVVLSVINVGHLNAILQKQKLPAGWVAAIFDRTGSIVARTVNPDRSIGKKVSPRLLQQLPLTSSAFFDNVNLEGTESVAGFVSSASTGYGIAIGVPKSLLWRQTFEGIVAPMLAILVATFSLLVAWHLATSLRRGRESALAAMAEQQRLQDILDTLPVRITLFTSDDTVAFANRLARENLGESMDSPQEEAPSPPDGPGCSEDVNAPPFPAEWTQTELSGREYAFYKRGVRAAGGRQVILEMGIDITDQKQAEREAIAARRMLEAALASMTDAIFITDTDGQFVEFNDAFASFHRFKTKEECAKNLSDYPDIIDVFLPTGELATLDQWAVSRALRGEVTANAEYTLRHKGTGETWVGSYAFGPIHNEDGAIIGSVVSARDITESKKIHAELERHRHSLEALVEERTTALSELYNRAPCGYHSLDANGIFSNINDTELDWLGYSREEVIGRMSPLDMMPPESQAIFRSNFPKFLTTGRLEDFEINFLRKDGSILPVLLQATAVYDADGRFLHSLSSMVDNSARKQANQALIAAREAAEIADRAKSNFIANMSHEIRTPMNAVLGFCYLLETMKLPEEAGDLVLKIRNAGRLLLGIINDILDFSKIESGKLEIEQAPFRLTDVLTNIANIMASSVSEKDIELIITPPSDGIDGLKGDALRLEQVLINLTSNAIKFTDKGHVEISVTTLDVSPQKTSLRFTVRDTGIGISEDKKKILFQPFSQADSSTTRRFGGSGLGLAISRRLITLMGGEIGLVSTAGNGSEFWFTLAFERNQTAVMSSPELTNLDVLIADDNPIASEALRLMAVALGWTTNVVGSGREAVDHVLKQHTIAEPDDVIILDWKMPDLDGLAAARAIHDSLPGAHEPIILMVTSYSRRELLAHPDAALVDGILSKPVTPSTLYNEVAKALQAKNRDLVEVPAAASTLRLDHVRMLVVDDSDINREVAQCIFSGAGAEVSLANDGKQALEWLEAHPNEVDIVLMDVQMPVMDGYEATRRIRQMPTFTDLPVVALTAGVFQSEKDAADEAGMTDFIAKPFDVDAAVTLIKRLTSGVSSSAVPSIHLPEIPAIKGNVALPGLAVERGVEMWRDPAVYQRYLRKFVHDYEGCVHALAGLEGDAAATLAHKLKGAAASLALEDVAAAAGAADLAARTGSGFAIACEALQAALDTALASIARYVPPNGPEDSPQGDSGRYDQNAVKALLIRLSKAFGTNNPAVVEPILTELTDHLGAKRLLTIAAALEDFDFRGGESATARLATELGIFLDAR